MATAKLLVSGDIAPGFQRTASGTTGYFEKLHAGISQLRGRDVFIHTISIKVISKIPITAALFRETPVNISTDPVDTVNPPISGRTFIFPALSGAIEQGVVDVQQKIRS